MKHYIKVKPNAGSTTHLKVDMSYSLGGMNLFTYKNERRGYYLYVTPVERRSCGDGVMMEGFVAFSGTKLLLKEVTRKSAKAEQEAKRMVDQYLPELMNAVLKENRLELEEGEL